MTDGATNRPKSKRWTVRCPECGGTLVIDAATGALHSHHTAQPAAPADGKSIEEMLSDLDAQKERAEQIFAQEKAAVADRDRLLSERFDEVMKRAAEVDDDTPPVRPFDLD